MQNNHDIQAVLNNLLNLRMQINKSEQDISQHEKSIDLSFKIYMMIHVLSIISCIFLIGFDLKGQPTILELFEIVQTESELKFYSVGFMLAIISLMLFVLYFLILRASKYS